MIELPESMNPSRHVPPHHASPDRRRARHATLRLLREKYAWARDDQPSEDGFRALPPYCAELPKEEEFPPAKKSWLLFDKFRIQAHDAFLNLTATSSGAGSERLYRRLLKVMGTPTYAPSRWREDVEFARQRLTGVNPMRLRKVDELDGALATGCDAVLRAGGSRAMTPDLIRDGRLFETSYRELGHPRVQRLVKPGRFLASPRCVFWVDDDRRLMPLAIQLVVDGPAFTPLSPPTTWLLARSHAQAADGCVHEGTHHLLETHLVSEAVAVCLHRRIHPDHPIHQLLAPHYGGNLAINSLARGDLLGPSGPIARSMAAGVDGTMEAARANYARFDFRKATLQTDLSERGVLDVPDYYYRDDALAVERAVAGFVSSVLSLWYRTDEDVVLDDELQGFCDEAASSEGAAIPGFPGALTDRVSLFALVRDLIFRAGPQHAAVNNGQFDTYGWVPNAPGALYRPPPEDPEQDMRERALWEAMPDRAAALAQNGMVWVLSRPTRRSLMHSGESEIFDPALCAAATRAVEVFRRRLHELSDGIRARNEALDVPYPYLDPLNISRSTDI